MACGGVPLALGARASAWPPRRPILMCAVAEPQETEHVEDAKRVAEYWKSLGMTVRTVNPTTHPTVFAEGGGLSFAQASILTRLINPTEWALLPSALRETLGSSTLRIRPSGIRAKYSPETKASSFEKTPLNNSARRPHLWCHRSSRRRARFRAAGRVPNNDTDVVPQS